MSRFLLDTNMLLGFIREAHWAIEARDKHGLSNSKTITFTSVVCCGEILALAEKNGWGKHKRTRLDDVLKAIPTVDINQPAIVDSYARISAWTHGTLVQSPGGVAPPRPAVSMGQNDMWIAATAHASDACLLSTDTDFEHLAGVWFEFIRIDQGRSWSSD